MNRYGCWSGEQLTEELARRAALLASGEVMDLRRVERHEFFVETGRLMQAVAEQRLGSGASVPLTPSASEP
jgi:hypothetical protein